jgi:hypothetical protein
LEQKHPLYMYVFFLQQRPLYIETLSIHRGQLDNHSTDTRTSLLHTLKIN